MKLSDFKNPLVAEKGNIFNLSDWVGGIMWVVFAGVVFTLGSKVTGKLDTVVPGTITPNAYKNVTTVAAPTSAVKIY